MQNIITTVDTFWERASYYMNLPKMTVNDVVEIIIIAFLIYYLLLWIKNTRAWMLLRGLLVLLVFVAVAAVFRMTTIIWLVTNTLNVIVIALVVIFQPEMRRGLENLGRKSIIASLLSFDLSRGEEGKFSDRTIDEMVRACYEMGKVKTGALIVVENDIALTECEQTGIPVDGILTSQLLINIFEKNTPLHDGAVLVRGDRVVAATCYLPLTDSLSISKDLGTRHRAAVGISETSDSLTIVVSEETGRVSIALDGELYRNVDAEFLKNKLAFLQKREQKLSKLEALRRRLKDAKEVRKKDLK